MLIEVISIYILSFIDFKDAILCAIHIGGLRVTLVFLPSPHFTTP